MNSKGEELEETRFFGSSMLQYCYKRSFFLEQTTAGKKPV
jgi:hypothetical protein